MNEVRREEFAGAGRGRIWALAGGAAVTPSGVIEDAVVLVEGRRILEVGPASEIPLPAGINCHRMQGCSVLPGFIDTHVHGCKGDDVMAAGAAGIQRMAHQFARHGVTTFFPTTVAAPHANLLRVIEECHQAARAQKEGAGAGARIAGIHLEGPYINVKRKGAQPEEGIRLPNLPELGALIEAGRGQIRRMTLAPELPGADALLRRLLEARIAPSIGHTDATFEEAAAALEIGVRHTTHLFNQMTPFHHRNPGVAVACLNSPEVVVELITDGIHVAPPVLKLVYDLVGPDRIALVTDAISAQGMPDGIYRLGSHEVRLREGRCTLADGTLAGSVHRMDRAVQNMMEFTGCSLAEAAHMASAVPARVAGVSDRKGSLEPGKDADLVVLRGSSVEMTFVKGCLTYSSAENGRRNGPEGVE